MDVVVSNLAWMPKAGMSESDLFLLKKRLTIVPPPNAWGKKKKNADGEEEEEEPRIINMWRETTTHVGVPRAYFMKHKTSKHNVILRLPDQSLIRMQPGLETTIKLRADDQEPYAVQVLEAFRSRPFFGGIMQAYTSYGKTAWSIEVARRLGLKTLILVHKNPLKDQWIERIRQFVPKARIGSIQGDKCQYQNVDFAIGMIQSMMLEGGSKYPKEAYAAFGLVIVDEVHRAGSYAFSTVAPRFNAPYFLGLSATPKRKDGCDNAFKWVIGEVVAAPTDKNRAKPIIYLRNTGVRAVYDYVSKKTGQRVIVDLNEFRKPTLLKRLAKNKFRNGIIIADVVKALKAGRSPLIMAERLDVLHEIAAGVQAQAPKAIGREVSAGMYIGGKKRAELDAAAQCDIVLATVQLAKEGIDIEKLDTLFMATPVSDPVQIIGRIGRAKTVRTADGGTAIVPPKNRPMVVDYIDFELTDFKGSFFSRLRHYKKLGFEMIGMKV